MRIAIAGGSGFIGRALTQYFCENGHEVVILTRASKESQENITYVQWLSDTHSPLKELEQLDAFINLAGESIGEGRWTAQKKERIINSRVRVTKEVYSLLAKLEQKPKVFLQASAIGYYGTSLTKTFTEEEVLPKEKDFLSRVCLMWEAETDKIKELGIRTVITRIGLVLDKKQGALPKILMPYRLFAGGPLGAGNQWISWIHLKDLIALFHFAINEEQIEGPLNITAPSPLTMNEFGRTIAEVLKRPHWFPTPSFLLKIALGEMSCLVLEGQKVIPAKALKHGFTFHFPEAKHALSDMLK